MSRHSWYVSPELAGLALFSDLPSAEEKSELISNMSDSFHLLKRLPSSITGLKVSHTFFSTTDIDDSFLDIPVHEWQQSESYQTSASTVCNIPCVNDIAERGVALIQTFSSTLEPRMRLKSSTCCKSSSSIDDSFQAAIVTVY